MVYVKTYNLDGDDLEGYVPRQCCKPINSRELKPQPFAFQQTIVDQRSPTTAKNASLTKENDNFNDDSIKYHSLSSELEYDNKFKKNQEESIFINKENKNNNNNDVFFENDFKNNERRHSLFSNNKQKNHNDPIQDCLTYDLKNVESIRYQLINGTDNTNKKTVSNNNYSEICINNENKKDTTHFSVTNYQLVNDYDEANINDEKADSLLSMQSRSRLPISFSSNLNLALEKQTSLQSNEINTKLIGFNNLTYKSPLQESIRKESHMNNHVI